MKPLPFLIGAFLEATLAVCQPPSQPVALTIYNRDFAVARTIVDLDLRPGINEVTTTRVTSQLEPDSVVLRDPTGKHSVRVVEQNYDAGVVNQAWMLQKYEGKTIDFQTPSGQTASGTVIRAGSDQPLIEVNGKMQFQLPGTPLFPASTDGLLLRPTLRWQIQSDRSEHYSAEFAYVTGGFNWEATYNIVAPGGADAGPEEKADIIGWVTLHNESGSDFPEARIKLMAGDVAKIRPQESAMAAVNGRDLAELLRTEPGVSVTQKAFDDFHLYDLNRTFALRSGETKQVQFLEASGVTMKRSYLYRGAASEMQPFYGGNIYQQQGYGLDSVNTKVQIVEEVKNNDANRLGVPLPAGRVRLYRKDTEGQMEFVGESMIDHTPTEDTVKVETGSAFDVKGSRRQTDFRIDFNARTIDESFEVELTNQKLQPVRVAIVEPMYRGNNWRITAQSADYTKLDSHTLEFFVAVPAKGETTLTYSAHYTW